MNDEIGIKNSFKSEIFMSPNINKIYQKAIKLGMICVVYVRFCVVELPYDLNIKIALKKMISSLTAPLVNLFDLFILKKIGRELVKNSLYEKIIKVLKTSRLSRNSKLIDIFYQFGKNVDNAALIIKQFSK